MFAWNFSFGLFPNHHYNLQNQNKIIDFVNKHRGSLFVLSEDVLIQNLIFYETSKMWDSTILKSPESLKILGKNDKHLREKIDSSLKQNIDIYTDCVNEPIVFSRKNYLGKNYNTLFFSNYKFEIVDSINTLAGKKFISRLKEK